MQSKFILFFDFGISLNDQFFVEKASKIFKDRLEIYLSWVDFVDFQASSSRFQYDFESSIDF